MKTLEEIAEAMPLTSRDKKYWRRVMFANEIVGALSRDGLLYMFKDNDIESLLSTLPHNSRVWYFNKSKDRECAERSGNRILVNPSMVSTLLGLPVIYVENDKIFSWEENNHNRG